MSGVGDGEAQASRRNECANMSLCGGIILQSEANIVVGGDEYEETRLFGKHNRKQLCC